MLPGIEFSGIDGTFLKHIEIDDDACVLLLVTRDGNNKLVVIAWVYCMSETKENYIYMAKYVKRMDYANDYLNRKKHLLYSDRMKGITHFEKEFVCGHAHCIWHIIKNMRRHCRQTRGARVGFHAEQVHQIQQAKTENEFKQKLSLLRRGFPEAANYLNALDHEKTFLYRLLEEGYTSHGHRTSNVVEIMNKVIKEAR